MIRSFPLPNGYQPSTVRLTVFVHTSQGCCLLGFVESLGHMQTAKGFLQWFCLWVLRRRHLSALWRVCCGKGPEQGCCECLAATFAPPGLLPRSTLVLVHSCLLLGERLHKHLTFATAKEWVHVASDGCFPDEQ